MDICVLEHPRIRSKERFNDIANTPLWSCLMGGYAASGLRQAGHDVCLLDATLNKWDFDTTRSKVLSLAPDMLCVNAVYFWEHTGRFFDFLNNLKADGFGGHITLFGFFPTLAFKVLLENVGAVDSVVVGECENTLTELADALSKGEQCSEISGLAVRASGGIRMPGYREPVQNPDVFSFPERVPMPEETASILASRGCYNQCVFCPVPSFYNHGPLWRGRTPENIFQEMVRLKDEGYLDFYFVDPNFIGPGDRGRRRIIDLMDLIQPLGITFGMETRPNDLDPYVLEKLVPAGFQTLLMGIESGSSSVLGNLNKGASIRSGERAIRLCREAGIEPEIGFLMFVPDSRLEDLAFNFEFLLKNDLLDRLERTANLLGHRQIVMMGTSGYRLFETQGRLKRAGVLGFEGDVSYLDDRVKWMSEIVIHACLFVLQGMERHESPIHWRRCGDGGSQTPESDEVNDYLVGLFNGLLDEARKPAALPPVSERKKEIQRELSEMIGKR